jgi:uncharacterized protein (DUF608 family)
VSYTGAKTTQISFPLGGIGSGCIGLGGDGRLIEWEIFNRPAKGVNNGLSHFAVKAVSGGKLLDARALCGEMRPPYRVGGERHYCAYAYSPGNESIAGVPNFRTVEFVGEFPVASLTFRDRQFPGQVSMTAFNPFIPLNDKDSSIPGAFFEIGFENPTAKPIDYTVAFVVRNPSRKSVNRAVTAKGIKMIRLTQGEPSPDDTGYGELAVATDARNAVLQEYFFRGFCFDNHRVFWRDFARVGGLPLRRYKEPADYDHACITATVSVKPRSKGSARFVVTWHYPNCSNYWSQPSCDCAVDADCGGTKAKGWKNYYATLFKDAAASAAYSLTHWNRLLTETLLFKDALFSSTLPAPVLDAVSANLSILKSPTVLRLEDGSVWGWEGCGGNTGCCFGSCSHVWNYAYAMPFLFPKLERSMRDLDYTYNQRDDGGLVFRLQLPLGVDRGEHRPCCDGQFGDVLKVYRDWKICGDTAWLKRLWPAVRKSIEFAWSPTNEDRWDADKDGVLEGRQHHTLDRELFGPNSWLTGFYLAALKAGSEMAQALGEKETAAEYAALFEKGRAWVDKHLFNGRFYYQKIDLGDKALVDSFNAPQYWSKEHRQIVAQIGEGSAIDQVVGQWHANLSGLGDIFDPRQRKKALRTIFKHNYRRSVRDVANPCRLFSVYDEAGVLICDWPDVSLKPAVPVPYSEETMYGFEYAAAALMIQEGLVKEGLEIVKSGRRRFDGERRNPWNEAECGANYARSMSSYSLLNALSGFEFDATRGMIGFSPVVKGSSFTAFWSLDAAWGTVQFAGRSIVLNVLYGCLKLDEFRSKRLAQVQVRGVKAGARTCGFVQKGNLVRLRSSARIAAGQRFDITL